MKYAIGIDLGGTSIKYALVDKAGNSFFEGKLPSFASASAAKVMEQFENGINGELSTAFSTFVHYIIVHKAGIMKKFQRNRSMQGCRTYLAKKLRSQKHQNGAHHLPVLLPDMRNYAVQQKVGTGEGTFKKLLEVLQFLRNRRFYQ